MWTKESIRIVFGKLREIIQIVKILSLLKYANWILDFLKAIIDQFTFSFIKLEICEIYKISSFIYSRNVEKLNFHILEKRASSSNFYLHNFLLFSIICYKLFSNFYKSFSKSNITEWKNNSIKNYHASTVFYYRFIFLRKNNNKMKY